MKGLSNLTDVVTSEPFAPRLGLKVDFRLVVPKLVLTGDYDFDLALDLGLPDGPLTIIGKGPALITFTNFAVVFDLRIERKEDSPKVDASLKIRIEGELLAILEGLYFIGEPVEDWEGFSALVWGILYPRLEELFIDPLAGILGLLLDEMLKVINPSFHN